MEKRQFADASTYLGAKSPRCGVSLYIYLPEGHNSTRTGGEIGWKWTIKGKRYDQLLEGRGTGCGDGGEDYPNID